MMKITACILQILLQIGTCAMVKHYNSTTGRTVLCESVMCQGALEFCKVDYSRDICKPCPKGSYMVDIVDSRLYENDRSIFKCVSSIHWSCPPEAEMVYGKITDSNQPPCECDRSRGYYGTDFYNCFLIEKPCGPGLELSVRGNCVSCPTGTFKPNYSFDLCIRKTNCSEFNRYTINSGSTTSDAVCGPFLSSSTVNGQRSQTNIDPEKSTIDVLSDSLKSKTNDGVLNIFSDRNIFLVIIIIPAVILLIVGPVAVGFCIRNRYSLHIKCCMEINRKNDRRCEKTYEIPLQNQERVSVHGRSESDCLTPVPESIHIENRISKDESGRRNSDNNVTITVHVHTGTEDVCSRNSDFTGQRYGGSEREIE